MKKSILFGLAAVLSLTFVPLVGVSAAEDEYRISEAALKLADDEDDFYEDDSSDVYEEDLPVPEIETLENGSRSVNISWICDDTGSIEGFYLERTKDGTNWNRIETINDPDVLDYEDTDIEAGDLCGYRLYAFTAGQVGEASVPEYTCFLKKIELRAVKSNASKKVQVKWADTINTTVSGYELQISSTKAFSKATTETVKASQNNRAKTIGKLKGGKKCYVRIRAYRTYKGENYYSEWSVSKSVKVMR